MQKLKGLLGLKAGILWKIGVLDWAFWGENGAFVKNESVKGALVKIEQLQ